MQIRRFMGGLAAAACAAVAIALPSRAAAAPAKPPSTCAIDGVERIVAIGDVHGAYERFVEILKVAGVIDDRLHWTGGHTHLVQTGDVVDRGPDSLKAIDLLRQLKDEAPKAGGAVHALIGNHEAMRMLGDMRYVNAGEYQAFVTPKSETLRRQYVMQSPDERPLAETPLGLVEMRTAFGRDGDYGKWLRSLDAVMRINGVLFMHGSLSLKTAGRSCDEMNDQIRRELGRDLDRTRANPQASLAAGEDGPLWYRGMNTIAESDVEQILAKAGARAIVVGHTVTQTTRINVRFGKVFSIDTGMQPQYVPTGHASALEIVGDVFTALYTD
ncbi:MAG TPA: metallophosphoesterase, partial [Vicinamibacterales bacterium]|nr:metallophosphoesterase [Vicinamibacterales bacterium]